MFKSRVSDVWLRVIGLATAELGAVLTRAVDYVKTNGTDGLEQQCQRWLDDSARDLNRRIKQWSFDE